MFFTKRLIRPYNTWKFVEIKLKELIVLVNSAMSNFISTISSNRLISEDNHQLGFLGDKNIAGEKGLKANLN